VKGLASTILARSARQLPQDWRQHYGYSPLLLETLVDGARLKGTSYRAANWIHRLLVETETIAFVRTAFVPLNSSLFFHYIARSTAPPPY